MSLTLLVGIQVVVVAAILFAISPVVHRRWPAGDVAVAVARSVFIVAGIVLIALDVTGGQTPMSKVANPVAGTVTSVEAGRVAYQATCAACHGVDARGGGPLAGTTAVTPPSLTAHLDGHSDGDLFYWISNGMPGGMPAWADKLSETDRWNLVNYLRSINGRPLVSEAPPASRLAVMFPLGFGVAAGLWLLSGWRRRRRGLPRRDRGVG
jgi:mono/diheme cytochrome c family protein